MKKRSAPVARAERSAYSFRMLAAGVCIAVATINIIRQESSSWESRRAKIIETSLSIATTSDHHLTVHEHTRHDNEYSNSSSITTTTAPITGNGDNNDDKRMPLFIGAGQGTTGTRSMYRAFCHLGIPSVHWNSYCIENALASPPGDDKGGGVDGNDGGKNNSSPSLLFETSLQHHYQAIQTYLQLGNCAIFHRRRRLLNESHNATRREEEEILTCSDEEFEHLSAQLHVHVAQVVRSGMIASLHDVPYAQMVPYILDIARQDSLSSLLIMTERDPVAWVASRTLKHAAQTDVVCQDHGVEHAFDITYCLQKWNESRQNNKTSSSNRSSSSSNENGDLMANLFRAYNEFPEGSAERARFLDFAAQAMTHHQEQIRSMSPIAYHVNFWTESPPVNDVTLPGQIWHNIKNFISPQAKKTFQSRHPFGGLKWTQNDTIVARLETLDRLRKEKKQTTEVGKSRRIPNNNASQGETIIQPV
jgi:hypothetical protein